MVFILNQSTLINFLTVIVCPTIMRRGADLFASIGCTYNQGNLT